MKDRDLALAHGLRACWSTPILAPDRRVLGTFAMYYREPRGPTAQEIAWVDAATHLAAIAIRHAEVEHNLRQSEARARRMAGLQAVSGEVHEAALRVREERELYAIACRCAIEQGLSCGAASAGAASCCGRWRNE